MKRKGLGRGRGKGYKNLQGRDSFIHSQSAKGRKQPQRLSMAQKIAITKNLRLRDSDGDKVADKFDCRPLNPKMQDLIPRNDESVELFEGYHFPKKVESIVCPSCGGRGRFVDFKGVFSQKEIYHLCTFCRGNGVIDRFKYVEYLNIVKKLEDEPSDEEFYGRKLEKEEAKRIKENADKNTEKGNVYELETDTFFIDFEDGYGDSITPFGVF